MEIFKKLIIENSSQVWTLISVIIGGAVTYITTAAIESKKIKQQLQKENLENILIPYCTCLENTIDILNIVYKKRIEIWSEEDFENFTNQLNKNFEYLKASKRLYLSKFLRIKLEEYKNIVEEFNEILEEECIYYINTYREYINSVFKKYPDSSKYMDISISLDSAINTKIKISILNKKTVSLVDRITVVDFIENDEPDNYRHKVVNIDRQIQGIYGAISCGVMDIDEIGTNEEKLAIGIYDFIRNNTKNETLVLQNIINRTNSSEKLSLIVYSIKEMLNKTIQEIDKVTK